MVSRRSLLSFCSLSLPLGPLTLGLPGPALASDDIPGAGSPGASVTLEGLTVPASGARVVGRGLMAKGTPGQTEIVLVAFIADPRVGTLELLALGCNGWVLALEPLNWRGPRGESLHTRPTLLPDWRHLRLERDASVPRGHGFRHESWTDYLVWTDGGAMRNDPVRTPLPGTLQAALAPTRAAMRGMVSVGLHGVPAALLRACPLPDFPVG